MALNGDTLGTLMLNAIDTLSDTDKEDRSKLFKALGGAIVSHIQSNAVVNVTSVSGVTTGGGVSGPGTGTIT